LNKPDQKGEPSVKNAVVWKVEGRWRVLQVIKYIPKEAINILLKKVPDEENSLTWERKKVSPSPPPATRQSAPTKEGKPAVEEGGCA
jgi:hypothetical protein